jgi:hypothetical protein
MVVACFRRDFSPSIPATPAFPSLTIRINYAAAKFDLKSIQGAFKVFIHYRLAIKDIDHPV